MQNTLRQVKLILYRLKRNFGVKVQVYQELTDINDVSTGITTRTYNVIDISRVVVLTSDQIRTFTYDLSFIAANKNFTYGGLFDRKTRIFIVDRADLTRGLEITLQDHVIFNHRRYEIKDIQETAGMNGYLIIGNDIAEAPEHEQHMMKVSQLIGITQNAN